MLINQMMGRLFGDLRGADTKAVQLKPGQVVKGEVLQKLDGQEALLKINHTVIRAKLEADLQPGQTAMLQVQPQSPDGEIVLRTVNPQTLLSNEASLQSLLKSFQLADRPEHRLMLRIMQESDVPLTREHARAIAEVLAARPHNIPVKNWLQSAVLLVQRSLPVTVSSVQAMHSVVSGPPLTETMTQLQSLVTTQLSDGQQMPTASPSARLITLLNALNTTLGQTIAASQAVTSSSSINGTNRTVVQAPVQQMGQHQQAATLQTQTSQQSASVATAQLKSTNGSALHSVIPQTVQQGRSQQPTQQPGLNVTQQSNNTGSIHSHMNTAVHVQDTGQASRFHLPTEVARYAVFSEASRTGQTTLPEAVRVEAHPPSQVATLVRLEAAQLEHIRAHAAQHTVRNSEPVQPAASNRQDQGANVLRTEAAQSNQGQIPLSQAAADSKTSPVLQLLKLFGLTHEADVQRFVTLPHNRSNPNNGLGFQAGGPGQAAVQPGQLEPQLMQSVKSLLLQLVSMEEAPLALKETAQQLTQQITGQQLLLQDRSANFTHLTLMLPMFNEQGEQTAAVSIHSRKKANGALDAQNCRLLFDLDMESIGPLMLDVNVVNNRVQIQFYNDFPVLKPLIESSQDSLAQTLDALGMELLSISFKQYPHARNDEQPVAVKNDNLRSMFRSERYKGVDLRI